MKPIILGMTGASGVAYGIRTLQVLTELGYPVYLILSENARIVLREEADVALRSLTDSKEIADKFKLADSSRLTTFAPRDFTAPVASGSFPTEGMIITPCTMGTLGALAGGLSLNLIHRAADCVLKEGGRLILVPRETPLSAIHLENMLKLSRLGVRMVAAMPGFYSGAGSVEAMVDFVVGKTLDQMGIAHGLYPRWTGSTRKAVKV